MNSHALKLALKPCLCTSSDILERLQSLLVLGGPYSPLTTLLSMAITPCYCSRVKRAPPLGQQPLFASPSPEPIAPPGVNASTLVAHSDVAVPSILISLSYKRVISYCGPSSGSADHHIPYWRLEFLVQGFEPSTRGSRLSCYGSTSLQVAPSIWVTMPSPTKAATWTSCWWEDGPLSYIPRGSVDWESTNPGSYVFTPLLVLSATMKASPTNGLTLESLLAISSTIL